MNVFLPPLLKFKRKKKEQGEKNVVDKVAFTGKIVRHSHGWEEQEDSEKVEIPLTLSLSLLGSSRHYK